ncbi:MAG: tRNA pseudouridine(54/55) synthase Pus10 [Candidatus Thermoplasmatota archaeon]|nr:tRNA pseudouridine(54/55) synthase Pus10 [Candidatus Thermoplasmatota archaeon]
MRPIQAPEHRAIAEQAAAYGLCEHCLGRMLARVDHGLGNDERGRLLCEAHDLETVPIPGCYICQGLFDRLERMTDVAEATLKQVEFETYLVGTRVAHDIEARDELVKEDIGTEETENLTTELNREIGRRLWERHGWEAAFQRPQVTAVLDTRFDHVTLTYRSFCLYGRYRKFSREIPQTRWPCRSCRGVGCHKCEGTGLTYPTSVEQLVTPPVLEATGATESKFHGAGREDVDALMLGSGRPFILEMVDPQRRFLDLEAVQEAINEHARPGAEVGPLQVVDPDLIPEVKAARGGKVYQATVAFDDDVAEETLLNACRILSDAPVAQRTPSRVAHRRADKVRKRRVARIEPREVGSDGRTAILLIEGDAGLYIKELISGDGGRTEPSLADQVGTGATCTALDVVHVEGPESLDEPPLPTE